METEWRWFAFLCAAVDSALLLRRSEQAYTRLMSEHILDGDVREFVICVRQKGSMNHEVLGDWLPVAELALVSDRDASAALPVALPVLCRCVRYLHLHLHMFSIPKLNYILEITHFQMMS